MKEELVMPMQVSTMINSEAEKKMVEEEMVVEEKSCGAGEIEILEMTRMVVEEEEEEEIQEIERERKYVEATKKNWMQTYAEKVRIFEPTLDDIYFSF